MPELGVRRQLENEALAAAVLAAREIGGDLLRDAALLVSFAFGRAARTGEFAEIMTESLPW